MPVPSYNLGKTTEADLNRAKKRVVKYMNEGIVNLGNVEDVPDKDAKGTAEALIVQFEEAIALLRTIRIYFEETDEGTIIRNQDDARRVLRYVIQVAKLQKRLLKNVKKLNPIIKYIDIDLLNDVKDNLKSYSDIFVEVFDYLVNLDIDENLEAYGDFEEIEGAGMSGGADDDTGSTYSVVSSIKGSVQGKKNRPIRVKKPRGRPKKSAEAITGQTLMDQFIALKKDDDSSVGSQTGSLPGTLTRDVSMPSLTTYADADAKDQEIEPVKRKYTNIRELFEDVIGILNRDFTALTQILSDAFVNYNEARQQKVKPVETISTELTGSGYKKNVYRIGDNVMSALYEIDGLPRFI